jgi:Linalool dehydratase/isomerase
MATISSDVPGVATRSDRPPRGPITAARQRRTYLIYGALCVLGALPLFGDASAAWQAAGLGLWLPGAGFVAVGGWYSLLFPLTVLLFVAALVAWFWAGMVVAPVTVWLGSAALAGAAAGPTIFSGAYLVVGACIAAVALYARRRAATRYARGLAKAERRREYLPASLAEVEVRAGAMPDQTKREIAADDLPSLRYLLDRSLQPVESFEGFDVIDQFQPAALRYQLNHMGFALAIAQGAYTPNFSGYLHDAQRNLIEKYLLRRVWDYWVYESCWGHLNFTNFDPARRDNIMLTGWFGMHVGGYMLNSGDRRYAEKGSLTFRLNRRTAYVHDFHSIVGSVAANYTRYEDEFCLFPCEPNWMYPICNHYGMTALASHDRLFRTGYVARFLPSWLDKLDSEFTDSSGTIIGLRSQLTGLEFPFPTGEAGYANFAHCFAPERANRLWAIARKEIAAAIAPDAHGEARLYFPGRGLDAGNYSTGHTAAFGSILMAAREFGDEEIAQAAQRSLDADCRASLDGGVRRYLGGSNLANISAATGRLMRTGDFRRAFVEGPSEHTLLGPSLTGVHYPDVLVARAFSHGDDLEAVLYPGRAPGRQSITIERLVPGRRYQLTCGPGSSQPVAADAAGRVSIDVPVDGRTALALTPQ